MTLLSVYAALRNACAAAGGQSQWAAHAGISPQYVSDVMNGRRDPGQKILAALQWRRVTTYERTTK